MLREDESKVLARGLIFTVSSNVIPKQQILDEIEKGIQKLPEHSANLIRNQVVSVLNNKRKLKKNLTDNKKKALFDLSKNIEISTFYHFILSNLFQGLQLTSFLFIIIFPAYKVR